MKRTHKASLKQDSLAQALMKSGCISASIVSGVIENFCKNCLGLSSTIVGPKSMLLQPDGRTIVTLHSLQDPIVISYKTEEINPMVLKNLKDDFPVISMAYEVAMLHAAVKDLTNKLGQAKIHESRFDGAKDSFIAVASHELRTPMTIIKGYADFLLSNRFGLLNDKQAGFTQKIADSTNQLLELVNNLMDISALESGTAKFSYKYFDFHKLIEKISSEYRVLCQENNLTWELVLDTEKDWTIESDEAKLTLVLRNLLSNALKFNRKNGKIKLVVSQTADEIHAEVVDTGKGIEDDQRDQIFQKFSQVDGFLQKHAHGTGLGLSIVQRVIETLGGTITFKSQKGIGTTFIFSLPKTK